MSLYDYNKSRQLICDDDNSFYSLIMAAIRKADSVNFELLKSIFPAQCEEYFKRYNAPGGLIEGDPGYEELQEERKQYFG